MSASRRTNPDRASALRSATAKLVKIFEILTTLRGDPAEFLSRSPHLTRSSLVELKVLPPDNG